MPKNSINSRYFGDDYFDGGLHQYDPFSSSQSKSQEVGQLMVSEKSLKVQKSSITTDLVKVGPIFSNIYSPLNLAKKLFPRSLMSEVCIINKKALSYIYGIKGFYLGLGISQMNGSTKVFEELALKSTPQSNEIKDEDKELFTKQKVCIIPGGTGHLGREYALEAIKKGYKVIVTTRNTEGLKDTKDLHFVTASHDQQCSPEFWKEFLGHYTDAESLVMINTVGAPVPPKGKSLREVNVLPPLAMITAMKELEDAGDLQNARFVHLSSMGAVVLEHDPYGITKKEAEDEILKVKFKNVCVLRVGYAFQNAEKGEINKIDNIHAYSPEQLAALWVQPLLGSGTQLLQPVFTGDIVEAGLNFKEGVIVVNAIGREIITQENFVGYFSRLADKKFIPIHVPLGLAQFAATLFPKGHFSPYAIEGCRLLEEKEMLYDTGEFEKLIGHQTSSLEDVYGSLRGKAIYYPMPPIKEHFNEAVSKIPQLIVMSIFQLARATLLNSDATRRAILNYQEDF